jgi:hypothetical protein
MPAPADSPAPLVGRTTLTPADGAALVKASRGWVGFFNQPRMLLYCALSSFLAAASCLRGFEGFPTLLLLLAGILYVAAIFAGNRTGQLVGRSYGRNQEREIVLDDDGVTVREPGLSIVYGWTRFERVLAMRDHLALVAGAGIVLLPKRAFAPHVFDRVREFVAAKVSAQTR